MDIRNKNVIRIAAVILLSVVMRAGLWASSPEGYDTNYCSVYGMAYAPYDTDCYFYIILDNGTLLVPEPPLVTNEVFPPGPTKVKIGYNVIDSIINACGTGWYVYLTCLEVVHDSTDCFAMFSYERIRCDSVLNDFRCGDFSYQFTNHSSLNAISFHWDFGDGESSDDENPVHYFPGPGSYTVCLAITTADSCMSQYCTVVNTGPPTDCYAWYSYERIRCDSVFNDIRCGEFSYQFTNQSSPNASTYIWDFGDTTSSDDENPVHEFQGPGSYTVCLTVITADGCMSQHCEVVNVGTPADCMAFFSYYSPVDCYNPQGDCYPSTILQFEDRSYGNITEWHWDFDDGTTSTEQNPIHEFPELGEYLVCLNISSPDGCSDTYCELINLGSSDCHAYFEYCNYSSSIITDTIITDTIPSDTLPQGDYYIVGFRNLSEGHIDYYWWDFGDGGYSSEENPVHVYQNPGYYNVCLYVSSVTGCYDSYCTTINVGTNECHIDFTYEIVFPDCWGYEPAYVFTPALEGPFWSIYWDFGDGNYSYDEYAAHSYELPGIYHACVEVYYQNNCYARKCKKVVVDEWEQDSIYYEKCNPDAISGTSQGEGEFTIEDAYPNPANENLNLVIHSPSQINTRIEFVNMLGQIQNSTTTYTLEKGENRVELDLGEIETGTYIYLIYSEMGVLHGRINIVR